GMLVELQVIFSQCRFQRSGNAFFKFRVLADFEQDSVSVLEICPIQEVTRFAFPAVSTGIYPARETVWESVILGVPGLPVLFRTARVAKQTYELRKKIYASPAFVNQRPV